ncbi:MAG: O-antigen ligase family protein [Pyrinomonadaceae bacterium]
MSKKAIANTDVYESSGFVVEMPPTRASKTIFIIICALPILTTILYGGVDALVFGFHALTAGVLVVLWVWDSWATGEIYFSSNALQLPIIGLILIGIIQILPFGDAGIASGVLSIEPNNASSLDPFATRMFTVRLLVYLIFFAASLTFINSEKRVKLLVTLIVIFGSLIAFFGILQRLANPEAIYGIRPTPQAIPFGPFVNQHHFAAMMEITIGLTLGLIFGGSVKRDRKPFLMIAAVLMAIALVFTGSRGGVLSFAGVFAFVAGATYLIGGGQKNRNSKNSGASKFGLIVAAAALGLIVVGSVFYLGAGDSLIRGVGLSEGAGDLSSGRLHFWQIALKIFAENPIFGAGLDAFGVAFSKFDTQSGLFRVENAHNEYLQFLAEAGVIGIIVVLSFVLLLFRNGLRTIANTRDPFLRSVAVGSLAGCFGILIHSFFDFPLRTPSNTFFFLLLAALGTTLFTSKGIQNKAESSAP